MTHGPSGGQAAPLTTDYGSERGGRPVSPSDINAANGGSGASPASPSTSTPWGSTSTGSAGDQGGYGSGVPSWTPPPTNQTYADAPTASVPLVQGTAAPSQRPPTPPPGQPGATNRSNRGARAARGPRRARLQLRHVNPWTVLKFSCVLSIALFFVWLIVVGVLFGVLDGAGIIHKINDTYTTIQGGNAKAPVTAGVVFGGAAIVGLVNIVLFIALSTIGSVVYNLCADLVGGIEITLSER